MYPSNSDPGPSAFFTAMTDRHIPFVQHAHLHTNCFLPFARSPRFFPIHLSSGFIMPQSKNACKDIFARPSIPQADAPPDRRASAKRLAQQGFLRILYYPKTQNTIDQQFTSFAPCPSLPTLSVRSYPTGRRLPCCFSRQKRRSSSFYA